MDRMPYGQRFSATGKVTAPLAELSKSVTDGLRRALEASGYGGGETLAGDLRSAGWRIGEENGTMHVEPDGSGMFSGRWHETDEAILKAMADVGFAGPILVVGEDCGAVYVLDAGYLKAESLAVQPMVDGEQNECAGIRP